MPPRKVRTSSSKAKVSAPSRAPRKRATGRKTSAASAAASHVRDQSIAKFLREECMFREDLQGALPSLYDIDSVAFADLNALRDVSLEDDHAERVRLEHLALASFPEELRVWRGANALKLYRWLSECDRRQFPKSTPTEKQYAYLELATTSFVCLKFMEDACLDDHPYSKAMHYPYILSHPCLQGGTHDKEFPEGRMWVPCGLMPDELDKDIITDIVLACGLDPATATLEDMDALDARLACKPCLEKNLHEGDAASNWWGCLGHFRATHCGEADPNPFAPPLPAEIAELKRGEWVRLNPVAEAKARELVPALTTEQKTSWRCVLCPCASAPQILKTWDLAQAHAKDAHGTEAVRGKDFIAQDNYVEHYEEPVYLWQLRKAGLQEYFEARDLDKFYFDKLIKLFGKIPTTFPTRPGEKCWWQNLAIDMGIPLRE